MVGVLLGDGNCQGMNVTACDDEIRDYLLTHGFNAHSELHTDGKPKQYGAVGATRKTLGAWLRNNGLLHSRAWEKFIPEYVKTAPIEFRLAFLQGLLDTDGTIDERGRVYFASTSLVLAQDVQWIVRSLGGKARLRPRQTEYSYKDQKLQGRPSWQVRIWHPRTSALFRLSRKKARATDSWNGGHEITRELTAVEYVGEKEAQCIKVSSPYGLYIADDFLVTHNTDAGIIFVLTPAVQTDESGMPRFPGYRGLVLRRNADDLAEWIDRANGIYGKLGAKKTGRPAMFTFPSGAKIVTNHFQTKDAYEKYQGQEFQRMVLEEATQIPEEEWYLRLIGSLRSTIDGLEPQVLLTANPGNAGHIWVRSRFVKVPGRQEVDPEPDPRKPVMRWVHDPNSSHFIPSGTPFYVPESKDWRIFVPAKVDDNPTLIEKDPGYVASLDALPEQIKKAWRHGDWDSFSGQFFTEFRPHGPLSGEPAHARHVIHAKSLEAKLQPWWPRRLALDWGYDHPAACLWGVQDEMERVRIYRELVVRQVGSAELGAQIAKLSAPDLDQMPEPVLQLSVDPAAWGKKDESKTIAENIAYGIDSVLGIGTALLVQLDRTIVTSEGEKVDITRELGYHSGDPTPRIVISPAQNTRIAGWAHCREMLRWKPLYGSLTAEALIDEILPKVWIYDNCPKLIDCLGTLIHDENNTEDVLKMNGDDPGDAFRYLLMAWIVDAIREPLAQRMFEGLNRLHQKYHGNVDPTDAYMVARKIEATWRNEQNSGDAVMSIPRRSSRRGKLAMLAQIGNDVMRQEQNRWRN